MITPCFAAAVDMPGPQVIGVRALVAEAAYATVERLQVENPCTGLVLPHCHTTVLWQCHASTPVMQVIH